ncbi:sulfotransferase, partial [Pseudoalteromonas shioyasakiensis]|uniref:sulfotransferase family protein n=1 Tax=Pseudoalteromonas shioyasakiensis TaxID=1190813 RepID=UPI001EFE4F5C
MIKILIGGCDRSGTTLLGSLLGTIEGAVVTPESQFKTEFVERFGLEEKLTDDHISWLLNHWRFLLWDFSKEEKSMIRDAVTDKSLEYFCEVAVKCYAKKHKINNPIIWIDHTPNNLRKTSVINDLFSKGSVNYIHIVRDPRAVYSSVKDLDWGPNTAFFGAKWYAVNIASALANEVPNNIYRVKYEDVLDSKEKTLKSICLNFGVDYILSERTVSSFKLPNYTKNQHSKIKTNKLDKSSAITWKEKLKASEIQELEYQLSDIIISLGYKLTLHNSCCRRNN